VAVDYGDTLDYARSTMVIPPSNDQRSTSAFMTGDVFDNDFSDESKLRIGTFQASLSPLRQYDSDEVVVAPQEPPDTDEDPLVVSASVEVMEGDMDDGRWNPVSDMRVTARRKSEESLDWGEYITVDDSDEWTADEVDTQVYIDDGPEIPIPAQKITTAEMILDLDEEEINTAGVRYVQSDLNGVPLYYSTDSQSDMEGDLYDNQRSDQRPLMVTSQFSGNPLVWAEEIAAPTQPSVPVPVVLEPQEEDVDEIETIPAIVAQMEDVDDLGDIDTVFEPKDIEIRDEDNGGDLDELLSFDESAYMVGDLYNNRRTDESKLTILGNTAEMAWPQDQDDIEIPVELISEPENRVVQEESRENVGNLYVTEEGIIEDVDEVIIPEVLVVPTVVPDTDELDYASPMNYMSGDLYDNLRTDTSLLRVNELNGQSLPWALVDNDDENVIQVDANRSIIDSDETFSAIYPVEYPLRFDQDEVPASTQTTTFLLSGNREMTGDIDEVPGFYSSDSADYVTGDLFNNGRSDASRLALVLQGGGAAQWPGDRDETSNPGFLP